MGRASRLKDERRARVVNLPPPPAGPGPYVCPCGNRDVHNHGNPYPPPVCGTYTTHRGGTFASRNETLEITLTSNPKPGVRATWRAR